MYFKKLELFGFKSFAEKTELTFEPGVTAIVGPNGCGKSNIADAIRWVLGEQSAKALRSSNMEDVIFNGSATKEALNFTEVSFVLSNEERVLPIDFDEVVITRRLFRSGESEYLINKAPVRLKDVTELLMGTGIGTEAYSLIEQGKIDLILSSKPEDRRFVFEEASGITKYKSKKKEALRKLEQTEQNLLRVNDIITEISRQLNSIERQAKKAEVYKARFEELKSLEVKLASYDYMKLSAQKTKLEDELNILKDSKAKMESSHNELKNSIALLSTELSKLENELSEMDRENLNIENQKTLNSNRISSNRERIIEYQNNISLTEGEIKSIKDKLCQLENELKAHSQNLERVTSDRDSKQKEILENENRLSEIENLIKNDTSEIAKDKITLMESVKTHTNLKNELVKLTTNLQNVLSRHRRLNIEKENISKEYDLLKPKLNATGGELNSIKEKVNSITDTCALAQNKINEFQLELNNLRETINGNNAKLAGYESKLEFLLDLKKRHEGFSVGTRALLTALQNGEIESSGVKGVLSELIEPRKDFEVIVELALAGNLEGIVVDSLSDARRLTEFLREKKIGSAKFFILNFFNDPSEQTPFEAAGLKSVLELVNCSERLMNLMRHLIGNCYLAKDIDTALSLCKDRSVRFITEQREIVEFGLISAGYSAITEDTSILTRTSRIKELGELVSELKKENILLLERESLIKKEQEKLTANLALYEQNLKEETERLSTKQREYENLTDSTGRLKEELSLVSLELDEISEEEATLREKENTLNASLVKTEEEQKSLEGFILSLQSRIENNLKEKGDLLLKLTQGRAILANISDKEKNLQEGLARLNLNLTEQKETCLSKMQALSDYRTKSELLEKEITSLEESNKKFIENLSKIREDLKIKILSREKLSADLENLKEAFSTKEIELDALKRHSQDIELELTGINLKCENIKNRINEIYKTELVLEAMDEAIDKEEVTAQIEKLKARLEAMGTVNLVAIEEHKELMGRHNFLENQRQDLVNAKDSLLQAIAKINKTTKELFMETFQKIQGEFRNFIRLIFGGGDAELLLIDREDVLESGIEIVAKPPGKRLQNITLLSGGEKALTAIALLFAIFKVKPSPFCVLDEIDAPMDESNIDRFNRVLQDFIKISQFIIITHNKKTITTADVMYGITMEESGISKIVSVKFSDAKAETKEPLRETV